MQVIAIIVALLAAGVIARPTGKNNAPVTIEDIDPEHISAIFILCDVFPGDPSCQSDSSDNNTPVDLNTIDSKRVSLIVPLCDVSPGPLCQFYSSRARN
jgi:hypothetical protein